MPHFMTKSKIELEKPFLSGGFEFYPKAKDCFGNAVILVQNEQNKFLILESQKQNSVVYKCEKATRPGNVGVLKNALRILKNRALEEKQNCVISHNLAPNTKKQDAQNTFLLNARQCVEIARLDSENLDSENFENLNIEIGFGSGRHLLEMARKNARDLHLGLEVHTPSIEQVLRHIELENLKNLFVSKLDARLLFEILDSQCVNAVFVHFPVPWENSPTRRVISQKFLQEVARVLKNGGFLHLRTDEKFYFDYALECAKNLQNVRLQSAVNAPLGVVSKYETRWSKQQKNIYDLMIFKNENLDSEKLQSCGVDFKECADASESKSEFQNLDSEKLLKNLENLFAQSVQINLPKFIQKNYFLHINRIYKGIYKAKKLYILKFCFGDFGSGFNNAQSVFLIIKIDEKRHENSVKFLNSILRTNACKPSLTGLFKILNS